MSTARPQLQVKEHLGKEQYKHRLLPLLRQFRQNKDGSQFTLGMDLPPHFQPRLLSFGKPHAVL